MNDFVYKSYLFSSQEFMVLSACAGVDKIHLLFESRSEQLTQKELNLMVFRLYQRGILYWKDENSYELKPEIRVLLRDMKNAGKELRVYSQKSGSPLLCFWDDYVVVMELSGNDKDTIKIHSLPKNDFLTELCDRGILPLRNRQETGELMEAGDSGWKEFLRGTPDLMQKGQIMYAQLQELLMKKEELLAFVAVYDKKFGKAQGIILILNYGIYDYAVFISDDDVRADYYTPENLKRFLA